MFPKRLNPTIPVKMMTESKGKSARRTLGYVHGVMGVFDRAPFYTLWLSKAKVEQLDELLGRADANTRCTVTLTASFQQPDRLRVTEVDSPDYEARAAATYVRGDIVRIHGRDGVSCGLDLSARFGVPIVRAQMKDAAAQARESVLLRVPSKSRAIIEFIPDVSLPSREEDALVAGSVAATIASLPPDDFSDWET